MSKKESAKRSNPIAKTAPSQMLSASATPMLSLSKGEAFAKISSVVALQARSDKRKSESLGGKSNRVETKSKSLEMKSKSLETYYFYAIRFFFCAMLSFFSDNIDII